MADQQWLLHGCLLKEEDGKMSVTIEGYIFDLDGVVVDTAKYHFLAWKKLANSLGFDLAEAFNEGLKGVSRMAALDLVLSIGGIAADSGERQAYADAKNGYYLEYISAMSRDEILPGVIEILEDIKERGCKSAIASASKNAPLILESVGIRTLFDVVVDGNRASRAKPDPEVFLLAAGDLGADPGRCVVFEDAVAGLEGAARAGMYCVGVGNPRVLTGADLVIPDFAGFSLRRI